MEPAELLLLGTLRPGERRSAADRIRYLERRIRQDRDRPGEGKLKQIESEGD
jgi:hypothetical protein